MKVLQVHGTDAAVGGGPIAMLRLHDGLNNVGVQSRILCPKTTRPDSVAIPHVPGTGRVRSLTMPLGLNELHCLGSLRIPSLAAYEEADLLHIHCAHGGFFNYLALPLLAKRKPIIYTVHDMWPFTGHCCYSFGCDRWKTGCGNCPYPELPNEIRRDATKWEWKLKAWGYNRSNVTIVAPSKWIHGLAQQSMLKHLPTHHIPYGVDTDLYRPIDQQLSRAALGIPAEKKVLLYIVRRMNPNHKASYIKGADVLAKALRELPPGLKKETVVLLAGEGAHIFAGELDVSTIPLGFLSSDRLKSLAFSASDLFVFPTRADNLPLVLMESLACGTPAVSFDVGGVSDMVRPGVTGLLAEPENAKQLAERIIELLADPGLCQRMRRNCRDIAVNEYALEIYIKRHQSLYEQVLTSHAA